MRTITLDEYYLTEQDEAALQLSRANDAMAFVPSVDPTQRRRRSGRFAGVGIRRRLHLLRRAAAVALAA
jgi:hypothetical protein